MNPVIKLSWPATREFWEIPVLHQDEQLLVLDKPAGLLTSPDPLEPDRPSLLKLLHDGIAGGKPWAVERGLTYLMNPHQLEPEMSGVLLLARDKNTLAVLGDIFGSEKPLLMFVALVQGSGPEKPFESEARLAPHPAQPGLVRVDSRGGRRARTRFETRERFGAWTLMNCRPLTDRPHQIRAHLRHARLPLAGDKLYGGRPLMLSSLKSGYRLKPNRIERPLLDRPALHAEELTLPHPATGNLLHCQAAWPKDLTVAVKYLRRYAPGRGDAGESGVPGDDVND